MGLLNTCGVKQSESRVPTAHGKPYKMGKIVVTFPVMRNMEIKNHGK